MNIRILLFSLFTISMLVLSSCKKDDDDQATTSGIVVVNEGQFLAGTASVSTYDPTTNTVSNNVFQSRNSRPLGDVAQSMYVDGSTAYIVVNNSDKIEIIDIETISASATINGIGGSPRYCYKVGNNLYVTDLYADAVSVVDLSSNSVSSSIPVNGWTEQIENYNGTLYILEKTNFISGVEASNVVRLNPGSNTIQGRIDVYQGPNDMLLQGSNLWVICSGDSAAGELPSIQKVDLGSNTVSSTMSFGSQYDYPSLLAYDAVNSFVYYVLNGDVYQMNVSATSLPTAVHIAGGGRSIYNIACDPNTGDLYVTDAVDYVSTGSVYRYDSQGNELDNFSTGIVPSAISFITE